MADLNAAGVEERILENLVAVWRWSSSPIAQ